MSPSLAVMLAGFVVVLDGCGKFQRTVGYVVLFLGVALAFKGH